MNTEKKMIQLCGLENLLKANNVKDDVTFLVEDQSQSVKTMRWASQHQFHTEAVSEGCVHKIQ